MGRGGKVRMLVFPSPVGPWEMGEQREQSRHEADPQHHREQLTLTFFHEGWEDCTF